MTTSDVPKLRDRRKVQRFFLTGIFALVLVGAVFAATTAYWVQRVQRERIVAVHERLRAEQERQRADEAMRQLVAERAGRQSAESTLKRE